MKIEVSPPDRFEMPGSWSAPSLALDRERRYETHLACEVDLGLGLRRYRLRIWNNFLYFVEGPRRYCDLDATCLRPLADTAAEALEWLNEPERLASWWLEEIRAARFGIVDPTPGDVEWGCTCIWACHGVGQFRQWWDDRMGAAFAWPQGEWNTPETLLELREQPNSRRMWHARLWELFYETGQYRGDSGYFSDEENAGWKQLAPMADHMEQLIYTREILPRHRIEKPLTWNWGSEKEAISIATAIMHLDAETWDRAGQLEGALRSCSPLGQGGFFFLDPKSFKRTLTYPNAVLPSAMLGLLAERLDPTGWVWCRSDEDGTVNESGWDYEPYRWGWQLSPPSYHEKIEAKIVVREWLDELLAEGNISVQHHDLFRRMPEEVTESEIIAYQQHLYALFDLEIKKSI